MTTRVCHVNDNIPGAIYVGRAVPRRGIKASKWTNPYKIGRGYTREQAIESYRKATIDAGESGLLPLLPELRNAPALACWCRHDGEELTGDNECHADVLVDLLERYTDDELRAMRGVGE